MICSFLLCCSSEKKQWLRHLYVFCHSWSILHVFICSYCVFKVIKQIKLKTSLKARGILHIAFTPPEAIFHFLDSAFYLIFFLNLVPFSYAFSLMFVLCFYSALGSTLEWVCLCKMIGGWVAARDSWSLRNCLGVWNTLTATALKVPWCSWRSHATFDTPSSFNIMFAIWDVDLFLSAFPEMNLFHLVIIFFYTSPVH